MPVCKISAILLRRVLEFRFRLNWTRRVQKLFDPHLYLGVAFFQVFKLLQATFFFEWFVEIVVCAQMISTDGRIHSRIDILGVVYLIP